MDLVSLQVQAEYFVTDNSCGERKRSIYPYDANTRKILRVML